MYTGENIYLPLFTQVRPFVHWFINTKIWKLCTNKMAFIQKMPTESWFVVHLATAKYINKKVQRKMLSKCQKNLSPQNLYSKKLESFSFIQPLNFFLQSFFPYRFLMYAYHLYMNKRINPDIKHSFYMSKALTFQTLLIWWTWFWLWFEVKY